MTETAAFDPDLRQRKPVVDAPRTWLIPSFSLRPTLDPGVAGQVTQRRASVTQQLHAPMTRAQTDKEASVQPPLRRSASGRGRSADGGNRSSPGSLRGPVGMGELSR
jgi:hypothetical protein